MLNDLFSYYKDNFSEVIALLLEHIEMTTLSLFIAILIGVPLGILISYLKKAEKPVLGFANIVQAIPSMALLGLAIPLFGIGQKPAIFLVVIYSLLPIIKNTYAGLSSIDKELMEAARGIGLTKAQRLFKVQLPLALPVIMAGIRISAVSAVGLLTLSAFVGGGGLGFLVFSGIRTVDNAKILAGAIPACLLALLVDKLFASVETVVTPISLMSGSDKKEKAKKKKRSKILIVIFVVIIIFLFLFTFMTRDKEEEGTITIASMDFSENEILAAAFSSLAKKNGLDINVVYDLGGSSICLSAIKNDEIDGYIDYTGTLYVSVLSHSAISNVDEVYRITKDEMQSKYNLVLLSPLNVNNTYTLSLTKESAERYNLKKISDLRAYNGKLTIASTITFLSREDGLPALKKAYGLSFAAESGVDGSARYTALMKGEADIIDAYSTDGLLKKFDLVSLEDDKGVFPPYYAVPVFRAECVNNYPVLEEISKELASVLTTEKMKELNYLVDEEGLKAEDVATSFLKESGLL